MNLTKFYINGEFVDPSSKETLEIINPATEEEIGVVALGSTIDVDKAKTLHKKCEERKLLSLDALFIAFAAH